MRAWLVVARVPEVEQGRLISPESLPVPMSGEITSCRFLAGQCAVILLLSMSKTTELINGFCGSSADPPYRAPGCVQKVDQPRLCNVQLDQRSARLVIVCVLITADLA